MPESHSWIVFIQLLTLAFVCPGQTPAEDAVRIRMVRYLPPHTMEIRRGAASLGHSDSENYPGHHLSLLCSFVEQADAGMLTIRSAASQESVPVI